MRGTGEVRELREGSQRRGGSHRGGRCLAATAAEPLDALSPQAYEAAKNGDEALVHELYALFLHPYDEQPDMEAKYYRRAPESALLKGGTAFMS